MSSENKPEFDSTPAAEILNIIANAIMRKETDKIGVVEAMHKPSQRMMLCVVLTEPNEAGDKFYVTPLFFVDPSREMMKDFDVIGGKPIAEKH